MIEVLEFIFQSFWHRLGAVILLMAIGGAFSGVISVVVRRFKGE